MALGGGTFTAQNKILPGAYINIISTGRDYSVGSRGVVTMPLTLDWGPVGTVFQVTASKFGSACQEVFGYHRDHEKMKGLRDLFRNATALYAYRVAKNAATATCDLADARYPGTVGNSIYLVVKDSIDDKDKKKVTTYLNGSKVDVQTVANASELEDNKYVKFKKGVELTNTGGLSLTGGTKGDAVTGTEYQEYLNALEAYSFQAIGTAAKDENVKALFASYTERMSEETGAKFQCVLYKHAADYEGVTSVENSVEGEEEASMVYWTLGASGGCAINASLTNRAYDGEFDVNVEYTQADLEEGIQKGKFMFHRVGDEVRVLKDINTLLTLSELKNDIFQSNVAIRVVYQIATDIGAMFNKKYLGKVPNDDAGRISFRSDIVDHHKQLANMRAIVGFNEEDVIVTAGNKANQVVVSDTITVMNTMEQLYMTVVVQ